MWLILLGVALGICAGIFTGLSPGIHINLVATFVLAVSFALSWLDPLVLAVFIASMSITHVLFDFIPSVFLGAPEEDTALAVFPAHQMLRQGDGYDAVMVSIAASLFGLIVIICLFPIFTMILPWLYEKLKPLMLMILIGIVLWMLAKEKKKGWAVVILVLCGSIGWATWHLPLNEALFPLFSGLFGVSGLLLSLNDDTVIPAQKSSFHGLNKEDITWFVPSSIASLVMGILPGVGASQAAAVVVGKKEITPRQYIGCVSALNMMVMAMSFVAWASLEKARNGSVVALMRLLPSVSMHDIVIVLCACLIAGGISVMLVPKIVKIFLKYIQRVNYRKLSQGVIVVITVLVGLISGWLGILVLIVATMIGLTCALAGVQRSQMMACLMIPLIMNMMSA